MMLTTSNNNHQPHRRFVQTTPHHERFNEDHLLVRFSVSYTCVHFVLVDLAQIKSSGKLVAVASAIIHIEDMYESPDDLETEDFMTNECAVCSTESGAHSFVTMTGCARLISIDEGTGKVHTLDSERYKLFSGTHVISQLSVSQFCVFKRGSVYDVWDINDPIKPVRECKLLPGFTTTESFAEGGFMFQISESGKDIHASDQNHTPLLLPAFLIVEIEACKVISVALFVKLP
ncbi:hypothetical protein Pelo_8598 [Pelomyxa schiedti]|nr:hypothetical protein Pelo_8598 [Pelomyxa schiedti]